MSGETPLEPVVSVKSGNLFEKSLVTKYVVESGTCPVTGEPLSVDDLVPVKSSSTVKPRATANTSLPGLLSSFQNEWDALVLESFELRKVLESTRLELSHALYQHDAACRVIAKLIKERDQARSDLASVTLPSNLTILEKGCHENPLFPHPPSLLSPLLLSLPSLQSLQMQREGNSQHPHFPQHSIARMLAALPLCCSCVVAHEAMPPVVHRLPLPPPSLLRGLRPAGTLWMSTAARGSQKRSRLR